jgi:hypothetical protein
MRTDRKQRNQIIALLVVLTGILGMLGWWYGPKLLPRPEAGEAIAQHEKLNVPAKIPATLFERPDYAELRTFGDIPVRALPGGQPSNPFAGTDTQ